MIRASRARRVTMAVPLVICLCLSVLIGSGVHGSDWPLPETERISVVDTYHGVEVSEDYRWLEEFDNTDVKEWNQVQNDYTRSILDTVTDREGIRSYLAELMGGQSTDYYYLTYAGSTLFAMKFQPPKEQSLLMKLSSVDSTFTEEVVLDVNETYSEEITSIDFYVPSLDGSLVAISLSERGSEQGTVHLFDVTTSQELGDTVPRVNGPTAGGDVSWNADGDGFYYTRYPHKGERPEEDLSFYQQVYFHKLGTPFEEDEYVVGNEFPRIAEIELETSDDGRYFIASVANGDGGEYAHYLCRPDGRWTQFAQFTDFIPRVRFGPDNSIYMLSHLNAPRGRIIRLEAGATDLALAEVIVEKSEVSIRSFLPTGNFLYVVDIDGGPTSMRILDLETKMLRTSSTPPVSSISSLTSLGNDDVLFRRSSYTEPSAWYLYDPINGKDSRTALYKTSPADFSDVEVVREFAVSKDGTKVPVNIIYRAGTRLEGENPAILYGYGGYGICLTPDFDPSLRLWLDQGGVYVVANLRGGGEYGEKWHLAGNLTNKQNVFDDFIACAEHLIERKYTRPDKLVIKGGSNGGLLMGAALTQRPDLFAAVVSYVGIYDMLRVELDPNGVFNITEFGTVENPDHFKALYAYSPYHNVKDDAAYPSILFLTGDHDGRVNPAHSRKMTALVQRASSSGRPVLLRTTAKAGHGGGTALSEKIERETDVYSFIVSQLGLKFRHDK